MREKGIWQTIISLLLIFSLLISGICIPIESKAAETEKYMVFFDSQGGSYCGYLTDVPENSTIVLPTPTKDRYNFAGWYTDTEFTYMSHFYSTTKVTSNLLLYAKWTEKPLKYGAHKIEYTGEPVVIGNYVNKEDLVVTITYTDGTTAVLDEEEIVLENSLIQVAGNCYVWVYYNNGTYNQYLGSVQIKGVKEPIHCIGFDTMGGSFVAPITGIAPGTYVQLPTNPTKDGYKFDGWYLEKTYETKFTANSPINKTFIVYAKWVKADEQTSSSKEDELYEEEYTLNMTQANLKVNQTESIYVNSTNPYLEVWYETSDDEVVSVDQDGIIKGLKNGKATIWVYTEDGFVFKCKVGVGTRQYIKAIETNVTAKQIKKGKTYQIKTTITPKAVTQKMLSYSSSNTSIAAVSSTGLIKAKKKGVCYITVKTKDGTNLKQKIKIRVV